MAHGLLVLPGWKDDDRAHFDGRAFRAARSLRTLVLSGADHALTASVQRARYQAAVVAWLTALRPPLQPLPPVGDGVA